MKNTFIRLGGFGAFIVAMSMLPGLAFAQITISSPGVYVLSKDIKVESGDAVTINVSGVTLDLNGHTISTNLPGKGRGVFVNGVKGVVVKNGKIGPFNMNVAGVNAENLVVEDLQIVGNGLAPSGGPTEIGILLLNTRGAKVRKNTITSVNLGIFVRGGGSSGNRIADNEITGGATNSSNLLGICYNPAPGDSATDPTKRPTGDLITNNHVARFLTGLAFGVSTGNILRGNTIAFFTAPYNPGTTINSIIVDDITVQIDH